MKTDFLAFVATVIFIATFVNVSAQKSLAALKPKDTKGLAAYVSHTYPVETKDATSELYKINFKAVQEFRNTYTNISYETWEEVKNGFVARFTSNSVRTINCYDKNGRWLHCIQYYDETKLPKDIKAAVKSNYYDYTITSVQQINMTRNNERPIYLVRLANGDEHKTIRVCDGEMEEIPL